MTENQGLQRPESESREGKLSNPRGRAARARCMNVFPKIYETSRAVAARARCASFLPINSTVGLGLGIQPCIHRPVYTPACMCTQLYSCRSTGTSHQKSSCSCCEKRPLSRKICKFCCPRGGSTGILIFHMLLRYYDVQL